MKYHLHKRPLEVSEMPALRFGKPWYEGLVPDDELRMNDG
jgi:hypothetical protein